MQQLSRVVRSQGPATNSDPSAGMPVRTEKPWGYEELIHVARYAAKRLHINAGHRLSLQFHAEKTETLVVLRGSPRIQLGEQEYVLAEGDIVHVRAGMHHRIAAGPQDVEIFEVSTPELDDVVRLDDDYGRRDPLQRAA